MSDSVKKVVTIILEKLEELERKQYESCESQISVAIEYQELRKQLEEQ